MQMTFLRQHWGSHHCPSQSRTGRGDMGERTRTTDIHTEVLGHIFHLRKGENSGSIPRSHSTVLCSHWRNSLKSWESPSIHCSAFINTPKSLQTNASRVSLSSKPSLAQTGDSKRKLSFSTYKAKATIDSRIAYGAHIWSINASPSSIKSLQKVQNSGCHASTPVDHLHAETKLLKV